MLVSGNSPEMFRAALERRLTEKVVDNNRRVREEISPRIIQVADTFKEISTELRPAIPVKKPNSSNPLISIIVAAALVGLSLLAYSFWASKPQTGNIAGTIVASSENKALIISSGVYSKRSEARSMQTEIEHITGDKVRIIKNGNYYTLQIGDSFKSREDAYLVFEELIKYPLRDLAIRPSSV